MPTTLAASQRTLAGKYLTFRLADEDYGIEILKVREIIGMMAITRVPQAPSEIRGVVNLRGKVIPVLDLRVKFGLPTRDFTSRTCIIVVQIQRGDVQVHMGIIVDEVSEVLSVSEDQTEPPPSFGSSVSTEFMLGMGKVGQRVLILLDIDRALSDSEVKQINDVGDFDQ